MTHALNVMHAMQAALQPALVGATLLIGGCIGALLIRVFRGPTAFDRLLAFNGINTQAVLMLVLIGTLDARLELFIDIAIGYAALSLVGSLAAAKYLKRMDHSR